VIQQGFECKVEENDKISDVINSAGRHYADVIRKEQVSCDFKSALVTSRGLVKTIHTNIV
jgi:hypothetical protein